MQIFMVHYNSRGIYVLTPSNSQSREDGGKPKVSTYIVYKVSAGPRGISVIAGEIHGQVAL